MAAASPEETLFAVYCAAPHCSAAAHEAVRHASLQRPAEVMIGGVTGWRDEGFELEQEAE